MDEWEKMKQFAQAQAQKQTREEKMNLAIAQRTREKRRIKTGNIPEKIEVWVSYNSSLFIVEVYSNKRIKDIIKEVNYFRFARNKLFLSFTYEIINVH